MSNKKIDTLRTLILIAFIVLGLLVAGVVLCAIALIRGNNFFSNTSLAIIFLTCYVLSVADLVLVNQLFARREALFRRQIWIDGIFDSDVEIWGDETFEHEMAKRFRKNRDDSLKMTGILYMHGFNNQPLTTFRHVDIFSLNEITLNVIQTTLTNKENWIYGLNRQNHFLFGATVKSKDEFFGVLQNIADSINVELSRRPSLPMAFVMLGANIVEENESIYEAIEHASVAARYDAGMRLSGDIKLFDPHMLESRAFEREQSLEIDEAIEKKQFLIYYQAKWNLRENHYYGAEALIRWRHPRRGYLPPSAFIPYAEASGKIVDIDHYVFETVCQDLARWKKERRRSLIVSVNLSRRTVYDPGLINFFAETIKKYDIDPKTIEIELTESLAAQDTSFIGFVIRKIKALGFSTSIDDFGIGYSSLSAIKNIEFDVLKLDKSFIDDVELNKESENLVASIINLVHGLGMWVIAEGVENPKQAEILQSHNLDAIQGYYYARPLEVGEFEALLEHNKFESEEVSEALNKHRNVRIIMKGGDGQ